MDYDDYDDADLRADARVQHIEQEIRDAANGHLEFVFTKEGRHLMARLGAARVSAAIKQYRKRTKE